MNKKKNIGPKIFCDDSIASKSKLPNVKANIDSAAPTNPANSYKVVPNSRKPNMVNAKKYIIE
jgi:hypothetical protein